MVETLLGITAEGVIEYDATGTLLAGDANRSRYAAPQGLYACDEMDEFGTPLWLALSVDTDAQWARLVRVLERQDWGEEARLATLADRRAAHDEIDVAIEAWTRKRSREEAVGELLASGIPAAPVTPTRKGTELDPIRSSDFVQVVEHRLAGRLPIPTQPVDFLAGPGRSLPRAAPMLGEHNEEILRGVLDLSNETIDSLRKEELIGDRPLGL